MVTILTRPDCAYCPMVKKYLKIKGITFQEEVDYTESRVPVTIFPDGTRLQGYNIVKLSEKINEMKNEFVNMTMTI